MGPLLNDWILARMMSAPKKDDSIIYRLENYICDGTENTAINTGLYLYDKALYPNGWKIYFDFTVGYSNVGNASFLRCRKSNSPYNGFLVRVYNLNVNQLSTSINNIHREISKNPLSGTRFIVTIENDANGNTRMLTDGTNGIQANVPNVPFVASTLVIGGELVDDTSQVWNQERFAKFTIHSLIITKL